MADIDEEETEKREIWSGQTLMRRRFREARGLEWADNDDREARDLEWADIEEEAEKREKPDLRRNSFTRFGKKSFLQC